MQISITVHTMLRLLPLYQPTYRADCTRQWQLQSGGVSKDTLDPVINIETGIALRAMGLTRFGLDVMVSTERA